MFRISKIYIYESNSQHPAEGDATFSGCSEYQRYTFMKAIHNSNIGLVEIVNDVQNIKDIHLWKQFTTTMSAAEILDGMFRISKIYIYESNSQQKLNSCLRMVWCSEYQRYTFMKAIHNWQAILQHPPLDVQNIKDIHLWKQFTTWSEYLIKTIKMFRISKIYIYESNSQQRNQAITMLVRCSEYQRYTFMKAIHNIAKRAIK